MADAREVSTMLTTEMIHGVTRGHSVVVSEIVCKIMVASHLMGMTYQELCSWIAETAPMDDYDEIVTELVACELRIREALDGFTHSVKYEEGES